MKFRDVTKENINISHILKQNNVGDFSKVYENGDTTIIYSQNENRVHASVSNPNREIKDSEIKYIIHKLMKSKLENVKVFRGSTGVIHFHKES